MNHRSTASFGKRQEYIAVAELLRRNYDVYMTLVDDQQIDCVVRQEKDGELRYLDLQIKARSKDAKQATTFAALTVRNPRPNFWYIFYSERARLYWIMPSLDLVRLANMNKGGINKGKFTIKLASETKAGWKSHPQFSAYENAFPKLNWTD